MKTFHSKILILIVLLILGGIGLRTINIQDPPLDLHAFRQIRSLALARKFFYNLQPNAPDELRIKANYLGSQFEVMEPPLIESIMAGGYLVAGKEIPWLGRLLSVLLWCAGGFFLYDLARRISNPLGGIFSLLYYLFLPYAVMESRTVMPNPMMVSAIIMALWAIYIWGGTLNWKWTVLAGILSGFAILTKVFAIYHLFLPAALMLLSKDGFLKTLKNIKVWLFLLVSAVIPLVYYLWVPDRSATNYLTTWTLNYLNLLTDPYFYLSWLHLLNGQFGLVFVLAGFVMLVYFKGKDRWFISGLWLSYFLFGATLPSLIITHTYYSLPLVPIVALTLAPMGELVMPVLQTRYLGVAVMAAALLIGLGYDGVLVRKQIRANDYRNEPAFWKDLAGQIPGDGEIIGLTEDYNMRMNYYGWRNLGYYPYSYDLDMGVLGGGSYDPEHIDWDFFLAKTEGYDYFLVTEMSEFEKQPYLQVLYDYYPLVMEGDRYVLFDLRSPTQALPLK